MIVKLLTEHHLEFLSLKGGCRGSSESATLLKITCHGSLIYCEIYFSGHLCEARNLCIKHADIQSQLKANALKYTCIKQVTVLSKHLLLLGDYLTQIALH